jgi:hypothetical protein
MANRFISESMAAKLHARLKEVDDEQAFLRGKLDVQVGIIMELIKAHRRCEASEEFLSIIGSYGDTLDDSEILSLLKAYNETGKVLHSKA